MRNTTAALFLISLLILTSCNSRSTQILLQDEFDSTDNNTVSLLLIEADHLIDFFPTHIYGALRPMERNIFDNQLLQLFSSQTQSTVVGQKSSGNVDPSNLNMRKFETDNADFTIISPKSGTDLSSSDIESKFTLIMDQYHFISYQVGGGSGSYAGHEQETQNRIRFDLSYLIWDNQQMKEVGWGNVSSDHLLYSDDIAQSYRNVMTSAFQKIVHMSPFQPA